jgi:uncharacterized repeat protein (TIGR03803 family)
MSSPIDQERKGGAEMIAHTIRYLFGASLIAALAVATPGAAEAAATLITLHSFAGCGTSAPGGCSPAGLLIADSTGALYGTTQFGGYPNCVDGLGCGVVFKLTPPTQAGGTWSESVLYSFTGGSDGAIPAAPLIADNTGALYGTTIAGGASGYGTVFKLTPATGLPWNETVLWSFSGSDGSSPAVSGLIADNTGALYGTTEGGGNPICQGGFGCGVVFKLTPPTTIGGLWTETVLYSFTGGSDGATPLGTLIADSTGALYGTTAQGGGSDAGTVFKLTPATGLPWNESILYSFIGGSDGGGPFAGLIADSTGALYGTTTAGGNQSCVPSPDGVYCSSYGVVFKLTPATGVPWSETVLWSFSGSDGSSPTTGGLIADNTGALYGTTLEGGGDSSDGTVFEITGSGFVPPVVFAGTQGTADCIGLSVSTLAHTYGGIAHAAASLAYASVRDLQNAITSYCVG